MRVVPGSPLEPDVLELLEEHVDDMRRTSPPESVHALDPAALAAPAVRFLTARDEDGTLLGCGALLDRGDGTGEVKSMRTVAAARGRGVGAAVLDALVAAAREGGLDRLALETGTQASFEPAVRLYLRRGFSACGPFGDYRADPNSRYLALTL